MSLQINVLNEDPECEPIEEQLANDDVTDQDFQNRLILAELEADSKE